MVQIDGVKIMHGSNGREFKVPELPHFSVDGYCPETRTIYEIFWCHFHGHTCQPFRDFITLNGYTLAEQHERTMARLEQMTRAGYLFEVQWESEFEDAGMPAHPLVKHNPLRTRDALYGPELRPCFYTIRHWRMRLYYMSTS